MTIDKKFNQSVVLMLVPVAINIVLSIFVFFYRSISEFRGYLTGTLLSMFFSLIWIFMTRAIAKSNIMMLFALSLGLFPVKLIIFGVFAFAGIYVLKMDPIFFGISFLIGTVFSILIEVWFIISVNKINIKQKTRQKELNQVG